MSKMGFPPITDDVKEKKQMGAISVDEIEKKRLAPATYQLFETW